MTLPRLAQDLRAYRGAGVSLRGAVLPSLRACRDNGGRPGRGPVAPPCRPHPGGWWARLWADAAVRG